MAEFKKKVLVLSSGKQLKLYGNSITIGRSLEIGEGYAPTIFASAGEGVNNPHQLSAEELMEIADYGMQLWMELKMKIRAHGTDSGKIFNSDNAR